MASASTSERASFFGLLWRGAFCGGLTGLVVGLLDALSSIATRNELVQNADVLSVCWWYAVVFAGCGLVAAVLATRFEWSRRATALLCVAGGATFLVAGFVNVRFLPDFTGWMSLLFDLIVIVAAVLWMRRAYHGPGEDEVRWGRWIAAGAVALLVAGLLYFVPDDRDGPKVSARTERNAQRPNVLVYMVDTLRADALSCYGQELPTSPEIDAFAADAVLFEDCRAPTSWTKPCVASLFTSLYPTQHACVQQQQVLVPDAETLAEVMGTAGWRTAAFTDNPYISPEFGFGQGFQHFDRVGPSVVVNGTLLGKASFMLRLVSLVGEPGGVGESPYRGVQKLVEDGFLPWIDEQGDKPWFAYVHSMEPHLPYDPPRADAEALGLAKGEPYRRPPVYNGVLPFEIAPDPPADVLNGLRAQYLGEVRDASRWFGRVIEELRSRALLENTIVVFLSDHGEELHDRGGWTHGHSLHRELVQVPLIVRLPGDGAANGRRVGGVASVLDVFPTILDRCGVVYPRGDNALVGRSLVPCLTGPRGALRLEEVPADRVLLGEVTMGPVALRSLRDGRRLVMRVTQPLEKWEALYDVKRDPDERRDQQDEEPVEHIQLLAKMDALFEALARTALTAREREIDADTAERLRALGYVTGK